VTKANEDRIDEQGGKSNHDQRILRDIQVMTRKYQSSDTDEEKMNVIAYLSALGALAAIDSPKLRGYAYKSVQVLRATAARG